MIENNIRIIYMIYLMASLIGRQKKLVTIIKKIIVIIKNIALT